MEDNFAVKGISPNEVQKYETLFRLYDDNDNGNISITELADLMPRLGVFLTEEELYSLFCSVDADGSGAIEFHEFLQLMSRHKEANQLALLEGNKESHQHLLAGMQSGHNWKIRSDGPIRCTWDFIMLIVIQYYVFVTLIEAVLEESRDGSGKKIWEIVAALLMIIDVVARSRTIIESEDTSADAKDEAQYIRTSGFTIDVLAAVPVDLVLWALGMPRWSRWARAIRIVKVPRVRQMFIIGVQGRELLSPAYTRFHFGFVPLLVICFWAVTCVHVLAICWCWITPDASYIEALYLIMYTLTTVGYGDVIVESMEQRAFCIFLFCCATVVTGLVTGKLVQFNQQADLQTDLRRKMLETLAALEHLRIPSEFTQEILAFQYHRVQNSHSLYQEIVSNLPQAMQDRMSLYARMKMVKSVAMFAVAPEICLAKLAQALVDVVVPPEEYIIIAGEEGLEMFFLFHGMCDVRLPDGRFVATIKKGGFFGEIALLKSTRRAASIKSITYCQLFRLDKTEFDEITSQFPMLQQSIEDEAARRCGPPPAPPKNDDDEGSGDGSDDPDCADPETWSTEEEEQLQQQTGNVGMEPAGRQSAAGQSPTGARDAAYLCGPSHQYPAGDDTGAVPGSVNSGCDSPSDEQGGVDGRGKRRKLPPPLNNLGRSPSQSVDVAPPGEMVIHPASEEGSAGHSPRSPDRTGGLNGRPNGNASPRTPTSPANQSNMKLGLLCGGSAAGGNQKSPHSPMVQAMMGRAGGSNKNVMEERRKEKEEKEREKQKQEEAEKAEKGKAPIREQERSPAPPPRPPTAPEPKEKAEKAEGGGSKPANPPVPPNVRPAPPQHLGAAGYKGSCMHLGMLMGSKSPRPDKSPRAGGAAGGASPPNLPPNGSPSAAQSTAQARQLPPAGLGLMPKTASASVALIPSMSATELQPMEPPAVAAALSHSQRSQATALHHSDSFRGDNMLKDEITKIEDSNIALYGSKEHKAAKEAKANAEPEWKGAGTQKGIQIWRVENFGVKHWPQEQYGKFFRGDAYIILRTYIPTGKTAFAYDLHFWLGSECTQDESGTAAFKTVELDDYLGDLPVQYRECDGYESKAFTKMFPQMTIMAGGVDSAFHKVKPKDYVPRLLKFKGQKKIRVSEVKCARESLNNGDVFLLDLGLELIQWNGTKSAPRERRKAMEILNQIKDERNGRAHSRILDGMEEDDVFWPKIGGYGPVADEEDGDDKKAPAPEPPKLYSVSDASGSLETALVGEGKISRDMLNDDDAFIVDLGTQIYVWVGHGATKQERSGSMKNATKFLQDSGRPMHTPIQRVLAGHEPAAFNAIFGGPSF